MFRQYCQYRSFWYLSGIYMDSRVDMPYTPLELFAKTFANSYSINVCAHRIFRLTQHTLPDRTLFGLPLCYARPHLFGGRRRLRGRTSATIVPWCMCARVPINRLERHNQVGGASTISRSICSTPPCWPPNDRLCGTRFCTSETCAGHVLCVHSILGL